MSDRKLKAIDVSKMETVYRSYKIVPYPEIEEIIKKDGEAFIEDIGRKTAYSAKRILSRNLGFPVKAETRIVRLRNGEQMEGYVFSKENNNQN